MLEQCRLRLKARFLTKAQEALESMGTPEQPWRPTGGADGPPGKDSGEGSSGESNARRQVVDLFGADMVPAAIVLVLVLLGLVKGDAFPKPMTVSTLQGAVCKTGTPQSLSCLVDTYTRRASLALLIPHSLQSLTLQLHAAAMEPRCVC